MRAPVRRLWSAYLQTLSEAEARGKRLFEVFRFGDREDMADRLAGLVVARIKSTTSALLWELEANGKPIVQAGELSVVTDWRHRPVCVIETTEVKIVPFDEVDAKFVYDYGEGDRSMNFWHTNVWEYYSNVCRALGRRPSRDMPLVCERFRVVFP